MKEAFAVLAEGGTVVTANDRLARSLALAWNRRERAAGRSAWHTPAVSSWRAFIEALHGRSVLRGGRAGERMLLTGHQSRLLWQGLVAGDGGDFLPGAAGPVAELAGQAWRLAQDWRIGTAELLATADSGSSRAFAGWAAAYQGECAAAGWTDAAAVCALLQVDLQAGSIDAPRRLHLAGFVDRTPLQDALLRSLAASGCVISEDSAQPRGALDVCQLRCRDAQAEITEAARWARQLRARDAEAAICIVVPELSGRIAMVRRAVLDVLAPEWRLEPDRPLPVNFSYGQPLARNSLVRVALRALEATTGRIDRSLAGQLLASRYLPGYRQEASGRARADLALRRRAGGSLSILELQQACVADAPQFAQRLAALATMVAGLPQRQSASGWAMCFRRLLEALGWPGDQALASEEYQAATAWQELLDQMRGCDAILDPLDRTAAVAVIADLAQAQLFQPAGDPAVIQVLGVMEAVGQRFDALWVCGMTSEAWPPAVRSNPLLSLQLQREQRMPDSTPALARERAERLLRWLETSAGAVVFSSPEFRDDEPLTPSPLLTRLPAPQAGLPAWREPLWIERMLGSTRLERLHPDPPPPVAPGWCMKGGVALLEREACCPARAFVEFRLGAREMPVSAAGLDAATRGNITHQILASFFSQVRSHEALLALGKDEQWRLLADAADHALAGFQRVADPLLRRIAARERERQLDLVGRFLQLERQRKGFRVRDTEAWLADADRSPSLARLQLRLRPDRIDEMPDGRLLVIDYKTGAQLPTAADWLPPRPRSPQLPLYATVADADAIAFVQLAAGNVGWYGLADEDWGDPKFKAVSSITRGALAGWGELRAGWQLTLEQLAAEFLAGCFDLGRRPQDMSRGEWAMAIRPQDSGVQDEELS